MRKFPQVNADLQLSDRIVNLIEDGIDVAVRIGHLPDSALIVRRLGETRRVVVASPVYLRKRGRPKHPDDLARFDTIAFRGIVPTADWRFVAEGRELSVASHLGSSPTAAMLRSATRSKAAVSRLP